MRLARPRLAWLVSLDRLPILALAMLLLAAWAAAADFLRTHIFTSEDPFLPVWQAYDARQAGRLMAWALAGLVCAAVVPVAQQINQHLFIEQARRAIGITFPWWVVVAVGNIMLAIAIKGRFLFYADRYLAYAAPPQILSLANVLAPIGLLAVGVVSTRWRLAGALLLLLDAILLFGAATRVFAGVVPLFFIGRYIAGQRVRARAWVLSGVYVLVALPVPLLARSMVRQGLVPYVHDVLPLVFSAGYPHQIESAVAQNIGFTVPLLVLVSRAHLVPHDLTVQLNPLPAAMAGWDQLMPQMRVHLFIPYSALGEWASFGPAALMLCTFGWALVVRLCIASATRAAEVIVTPLVASQLGMSLISMVLLTQYNTRSVSRVLSMMVALALAERLTRGAVRRALVARAARRPSLRRAAV